jgi:cobalt/nickel transport system permease protein
LHIPDGIFPIEQAIGYLVVAVIFLAYSIYRVGKDLEDKHIPLLGVLAAGIFAAQMFNFPVPYGSSGHLVGTALATAYVGPAGAIIIIASVLLVQAFFGDGGITAYGANVFNMGIVGGLVAWVVIGLVTKLLKDNKNVKTIAVGIAGFAATVISAFVASIELIGAGLQPAALVIGWMVGLHAIIGIGEAVISMAIVAYTARVRPDLLEMTHFELAPGVIATE